MAKILISSLGTGIKSRGTYNDADYQIDGKVYSTSFIADALHQHRSFDTIFLIGTTKSIWDEAYMAFGGADDDYAEALYEAKENGQIDDELLARFRQENPHIKPVVISYGLNDEELWENFEHYLEIGRTLGEGDELYLDITHSFRSLALMSFVMTRFVKSISEIELNIQAVYYGMFEYARDNDGKTPIVDLKILVEIADWIEAIDAIKHYSDFNLLIRLLDKYSIEKETENTFVQLNNAMSLMNIAALKGFVDNAAKKLKTIEKTANPVIRQLSSEIRRIVERLQHEEESDFQFALARWLYENHNFALAYIALYEAVITKSCELAGLDTHDHDRREEAKRSIGDDRYGKYFYTKYEDSISKIRNSIVHQHRDRENLAQQDIQRLGRFLDHFEGYFKIGSK